MNMSVRNTQDTYLLQLLAPTFGFYREALQHEKQPVQKENHNIGNIVLLLIPWAKMLRLHAKTHHMPHPTYGNNVASKPTSTSIR